MVKDQPNHPLKPKNIQNLQGKTKKIENTTSSIFLCQKMKATHKKARRVIKNHRYTRINTDVISCWCCGDTESEGCENVRC